MVKNLNYIIAGIFFIIFVSVLSLFVNSKSTNNLNDNKSDPIIAESNIINENGTQIIKIKVDGGYSPSTTVAKAGIPTKIEFDGGSGYDCSHGVNIPSIGYSEQVPSSGSIYADLGTPASGLKIAGICSMGMYRFNVSFN